MLPRLLAKVLLLTLACCAYCDESKELANFRRALPQVMSVYAVSVPEHVRVESNPLSTKGAPPVAFDVIVNDTSAPVLLVLTSKVPTAWRVGMTRSTHIAGVVVTGMQDVSLEGLEPNTPRLISTRKKKGGFSPFYASTEDVDYLMMRTAILRLTGSDIDHFVNHFHTDSTFYLGKPVTKDQEIVSTFEFTPRDSEGTAPKAPKTRVLDPNTFINSCLDQKKLRFASLQEMRSWYNAARKQPGWTTERLERISDYAPINLQQGSILVVNEQIELPDGLAGAHSRTFLVPNGDLMPTGPAGHCTFLMVDGTYIPEHDDSEGIRLAFAKKRLRVATIKDQEAWLSKARNNPAWPPSALERAEADFRQHLERDGMTAYVVLDQELPIAEFSLRGFGTVLYPEGMKLPEHAGALQFLEISGKAPPSTNGLARFSGRSSDGRHSTEQLIRSYLEQGKLRYASADDLAEWSAAAQEGAGWLANRRRRAMHEAQALLSEDRVFVVKEQIGLSEGFRGGRSCLFLVPEPDLIPIASRNPYFTLMLDGTYTGETDTPRGVRVLLAKKKMRFASEDDLSSWLAKARERKDWSTEALNKAEAELRQRLQGSGTAYVIIDKSLPLTDLPAPTRPSTVLYPDPMEHPGTVKNVRFLKLSGEAPTESHSNE